VSNILSHPSEPKYRRLRLTNAALQQKLLGRSGGEALLRGLGFVRQQGEQGAELVLRGDDLEAEISPRSRRDVAEISPRLRVLPGGEAVRGVQGAAGEVEA